MPLTVACTIATWRGPGRWIKARRFSSGAQRSDMLYDLLTDHSGVRMPPTIAVVPAPRTTRCESRPSTNPMNPLVDPRAHLEHASRSVAAVVDQNDQIGLLRDSATAFWRKWESLHIVLATLIGLPDVPHSLYDVLERLGVAGTCPTNAIGRPSSSGSESISSLRSITKQRRPCCSAICWRCGNDGRPWRRRSRCRSPRQRAARRPGRAWR